MFQFPFLPLGGFGLQVDTKALVLGLFFLLLGLVHERYQEMRVGRERRGKWFDVKIKEYIFVIFRLMLSQY
jgi:hypothetical protein